MDKKNFTKDGGNELNSKFVVNDQKKVEKFWRMKIGIFFRKQGEI